MILKFSDSKLRESFLELVQAERPGLRRLLRVTTTLPHIVVKELDESDTNWVITRVAPFGKPYGNAKFVVPQLLRDPEPSGA